jgi:prevent-host-death family protein
MQRKAVAEVKRDFRRVLDAAEHGESTVVLRHGRPVAVIVPVPPADRCPPLPRPRKPGGLLALVGTFAEWPEIEADLAAIVAARQRTSDRPPPDFD